MQEWWTYGLSDFLMFSPQAYWRLVARANAAWWPAQGLGLAGAAALCWLLWRGGTRAPCIVLALAWAWVSFGFLGQRYAEIFLAAPGLAAAAGVQGLLLVLAGVLARPGTSTRAGAWAAALALLYPLLAPLTGHPLAEAEVFGFLPTPTALATLGLLPALAPAWRIAAGVLPVLFLLLEGATRWLVG